MQNDFRRTATFSLDFDITPADAANTCTQCLHYGFFGSKATRQLGCTSSAIRLFSGRVDLLQKSLRVAGIGNTYPLDLDYVYADVQPVPSRIRVPIGTMPEEERPDEAIISCQMPWKIGGTSYCL